MARHELRDLDAQCAPRCRHHIGFGTAGVGNDGAHLQMRRDDTQNRFGLGYRRRDQDQVGVPQAACQRIGFGTAGAIDDAQRDCAFQRCGGAAHADNLRCGSGLFLRQRK
jgi:hypothetical protein